MAGNYIHLNELWERYIAASGYHYSGNDILITQIQRGNPYSHKVFVEELCQSLDKDMSEAAFAGRLRFHGAPVTDSHANSSPSSYSAPEDIPATYFAVTRHFEPTKISGRHNSHAERDDNLFLETRFPNSRHPDYERVLVHREGVEEFISGLRHFASRLPGFHSASDGRSTFSLCEAITFLAFGQCIDSSRITEFLDPDWRKRDVLAKQVHKERKANPEYAHFPASIPLECGEIIGFFIEQSGWPEEIAKPWPPSATELKQLAIAQNSRALETCHNIEMASASIYTALRRGQLKATGVPTSGKSAEPIPPEHLRPFLNLGLNNSLCLESSLENILSENSLEWSEVLLDGDAFRKWVGHAIVHRTIRTRDELVNSWWAGKLSTNQAEEIASKNSWRPLLKATPKSAFDPFLVPNWPIQMTVAWLIWRTNEMVIEFDPEYRAGNETVYNATPKEFGPRPIIETRPKPSLAGMMAGYIGFTCDENIEVDEAPRFGNVTEALAQIRVRCIQGNLRVKGFNGLQLVEIPQDEWEHIKFETGEVGKPDGDIACYRQGVVERRYSDLRFAWKEVLECWPKHETSHDDGRSERKVCDALPTLSEVELIEIYNERVRNWPADKQHPDRDDDYAWFQTRSAQVNRELVREIRKNNAPETWTQQGRPRTKYLAKVN